MAWTTLCELEGLGEGEGKFAQVGGFALAVFLHKGRVYALDNACPHAGGSLADGFIDDDCAVCPLHNWSFRLDSGEMPGELGAKVRTYPTRIYARGDGRRFVQADLPIF